MGGTIVVLRLLIALVLLLPAPAGATAFVAIGDYGVGGDRQRALGQAVRTYVEATPTDLLVTLGDNDYTRGQWFTPWWVESFGWLRGAGMQVAGSLGNHDVEYRRGRHVFAALGMPAPYYVKRVGALELVVLDSTSITPTQTRWLRRTLARPTKLKRVVAFHHPPYTCGGHSGSAAIRRAWVPLFQRYRVRLVLNGHDHNYQRFAVRRGVTYVVHGGGAAGLYPLRSCPRWYPRRVAARVGHGFLHVTVEQDGFLVRVLDLQGRTIDRFRVT
jgi:3',5'-cyclic AMP phosphodiesterase CpdA